MIFRTISIFLYIFDPLLLVNDCPWLLGGNRQSGRSLEEPFEVCKHRANIKNN